MISASTDFARLQQRLTAMARKLAEARAAQVRPGPDKWRSASGLWPLF
jgi:hypothetical protein